MEATLYFDGGIRQGTMAYGWLLVDKPFPSIIAEAPHYLSEGTKIIASGKRTCGEGTSNIAEYRALIAGLQGSLKAGVDTIHIIGDSQLIVRQVIGVYKAKKPELIKHRDLVLELLSKFEDYSIKWVPRHLNKRADALVNEVFLRRKEKGKVKRCKKQRKR
jgi:ribonuclease HI